jgi:hypothetical protein
MPEGVGADQVDAGDMRMDVTRRLEAEHFRVEAEFGCPSSSGTSPASISEDDVA